MGRKGDRNMKNETTKPQHSRSRVGKALLATAAVLACLAIGPRDLRAGDGGGLHPGGGDAIGSLPYILELPPEGLTGPTMPSISLEGPSLSAVLSVVVDAWGDGYAQLSSLGNEPGVRVELQGSVSLLLDRNRLPTSGVRIGLDVSQGFSGGLGVVMQKGRVLRTQILPETGDLELPLDTLAASGALDTFGLSFHSYSTSMHHHVLDMVGSGGTIRLSSHP